MAYDPKIICANCDALNPVGRLMCISCNQVLKNSAALKPAKKKSSLWRKIRIIWFFLFIIGLGLSYFLAMQKPADYQPGRSSPGVKDNFTQKLNELDKSSRYKTGYTLSATAEELNAFFRDSLALDDPGATFGSRLGDVGALGENADLEELEIVDAQVDLIGDRIVSMFVFTYKGKTLYLKMEGRPRIDENHYFRFDTTSVRMGKLPVPAFAVQMAIDKALKEPATARQLKMPDSLEAIWVEDGLLKVKSR